MQALVIIAYSVRRRGHNIDHAIRTTGAIDCRCRIHADFIATHSHGSSEGTSPVFRVDTFQIVAPEFASKA